MNLIVLIFSTPVPSSLNYDATNGVGGVFGDSIEYPPSLKLWRDKLSIVYCKLGWNFLFYCGRDARVPNTRFMTGAALRKKPCKSHLDGLLSIDE